MNWRQIIPTVFTLIAMLTGFFSMLASASGHYILAAQLIIFSMLLDGLDGTLARVLRGTTTFGAELDTYVDMTSFGLAPAVLLYELSLKDFGIRGVLMVSAIVLSGVVRLSRFRAVDPLRGQRGYLGLPITTAAGWMASFVIVTESGVLDELWISLTHGPLATFFWTSTLIFLVLQVSHVRYIKPTKNPRIFVPFTMLLICLFLKAELAVAAASTLCAYAFYYAFISPFFYKRQALVMGDQEEEEAPISIHR